MRGKAKIIAGIIVIAVLIAICVVLVRTAVRFVGNVNVTAPEPDPMFAATAEPVTRPPEMDAVETQPPHPTLDDYVPDVETPVDKTAAELAREAESKQ